MPFTIETEKYHMEVHDDTSLIEYTVKEGITFDVTDAMDGKRKLTALRPQQKFYVLGKGIGFFNITSEARAMLATEAYSDNTIAIAFYTPNISLQLVGEMYLKLNKPAVPTRIFKSLKSAREWLQEQMDKNSGVAAGH